MLKKISIIIAQVVFISGCAGQMEERGNDHNAKILEAQQAVAEASAKENWTDEEKNDFNRLLCEAKNLVPEDCDGCKVWGLYNNQRCEKGCLTVDPDCPSSNILGSTSNPSTTNNSGQTNTSPTVCSQGTNQCCLGSICNTLNLTCSPGYAPTFSGCNNECQAVGVCSPTTIEESQVTVKGNGATGYSVSIFAVLPASLDYNTLMQAKIGTEGEAPLDPVADGDISFKVAGNADHAMVFWILSGSQLLSSTFGPSYFVAGQSQIITLPPGSLNVPPPSSGTIPVTIQDLDGAKGFNVWVDGKKMAQDGVGETADGKVTVSLKPNQTYLIQAGNANWCCGGKITLPDGITSKQINLNSSICYGGVCP